MKKPRIKIVGNIHSNAYFCRDAVLVRLMHGMNTLRWKRGSYKDYYTLYFEGRPVVYATMPDCGTCGDCLRRGYGDKISTEESRHVRDRINAGFQNLEQSVKDIVPILGLLADGDYVIADYDLHPCIEGTHFWNGKYDGPDLLHDYYVARGGGSIIYDSPLCLYPTERAACMEKERVMYYKKRLTEGNHYPRAVAYYLSGGIALLLDGHHKAAAAACEGELVRCLVIMHVNMTGSSEWMSLNHNKAYEMQDGRQWDGYSMSLNDREGNIIGQVKMAIDKNLPVEKEKIDLAGSSDAEWGSVPDEMCRQIKNYCQYLDVLADGMMIPRDGIRREFDKLVRHIDPENDDERLGYLLAYCRAFPDSKWITENEREWLEEMLEEYWRKWK